MKAEIPVRWSYAGGVLASGIVLRRISEQVGCDPEPPGLPPVGGAVLRAALLADGPSTAPRHLNKVVVLS